MAHETFLNGRVGLCCGDSLHFLMDQPDNRYDSIVTDPPYALVSITKRFGANGAAPVKVPEGGSGAYARASAGFMGKKWDTGETAFAIEFWEQCLRVLKPGGHVVAFSGTRTYHRLACAIEDAGFEIRDMVGYLYGSGFPKSHNISKNIDICTCEAVSERRVRSVPKADVPQAPFAGEGPWEVLLHGLPQQDSHRPMLREDAQEGPHGSKEPSVEGWGDVSEAPRQLRERPLCPMPARTAVYGAGGRLHNGASVGHGEMGPASVDADGMRPPSGSQATQQPANELGVVAGQPEPQVSGAWDNCGRCGKPLVSAGLGTALKPAQEPICLARKPLDRGLTVAANVLRWGTGAINIDGCRVATDEVAAIGDPSWGGPMKRLSGAPGQEGKLVPRTAPHNQGRWPANILHDGSEEVLAAFPDAPGQQRGVGPQHGAKDSVNGIYGNYGARDQFDPRGDVGSAARFFYTAKADADDRLGSKHPTVKPVDLMQWLVRLVTPKGGLVLDPFAGTGTTAEACYREGMRCMLIERETEYQADIRRRMGLVMGGPEERRRESIKAKKLPVDHGPLFGGSPILEGGGGV